MRPRRGKDGRRGSLRRLAAALAAAALATVLAGVGASPASACSAEGPRRWFCGYSGAPETFTVPAGVGLLTIDAIGGAGGNVANPMNNSHNIFGGRAAEASGVVHVTPGEQLTVWVGGAGGNDKSPGWGAGSGGWGGSGYWDAGSGSSGGGGGSSEVAIGAEALVVAGGGGGGGGWSWGSEGGGRQGGDGGTGGNPPGGGGPGVAANPPAQVAGGCAACAASGTGGQGEDGSGVWGNGGGGGGGGGYVGGGGGKSAGWEYESPGGGGGGGAGSSFVADGVDHASIVTTNQGGNGAVYFTEGVQQVFAFQDGCPKQEFDVPDDVNLITIDALGGGGGSVKSTYGGTGGKGGGTIATVPVKPGSELGVYVGAKGQDHVEETNTGFGGCGQGRGGNRGEGPGLNADAGGGGGGSSAVLDGSADLVVGGGGGGAGGESLGGGGDGGSGGNGGPGWPGEGGSGTGAGAGGCASCTGGFEGADGEDASFGDDGGGGGGGGAGYQGGQGGNSGQAGGGGGGGGGAGRSYAEDPSACASRLGFECPAATPTYYSAAALANGQVTIAYIPVGGIDTAGGDRQSAVLGRGFATALSVKVTDTDGSPLASVPIQFALPSTGPSASFAGGGATAVVESDSDGVATSPALTANWSGGTWQASAALAGDGGTGGPRAAFSLTNAPLPSATHLASSSRGLSRLGEAIHFTATVEPGSSGAPTPTGTVQFAVDGSDLGSPVALAGGTADSPTLSSLALGDHAVTASYSGDADELPSEGTLTQSVIKGIAVPKTTPSTPYLPLGDSITDLAVVTGNAVAGTPTGTVNFHVCGPQAGGSDCAVGAGKPVGAPVSLARRSADSSSARSASFTPSEPGVWCFESEYSGDGNYVPGIDATDDECFTVPPVIDVPCDPAKLIAAIEAPPPFKTLSLAPGCTYTLTDPITGPDGSVSGLPSIGTGSAAGGTLALILEGHGATITRSAASGTPPFRILEVSGPTAVTGRGWLMIRDLTVTGGLTDPGDAPGAGIDNGGAVTVVDSTLAGNDAWSGAGGGIANHAGGVLTVANSTVAGNYAATGGGIGSAGTLTLEQSTVVGNDAGRGGGIERSGGTAALLGTLVAGNRSGDGPDCFGALTDTAVGHNLIGDGTGCTGIVDGTNGDQVGTGASPIDPRLDPAGLTDNGGPTPTVALEPSSPAIDAVPVGSCVDAEGLPVTTDQRGVRRPQGPACDIGAFEREPALPDPPVVPPANPSANGRHLAPAASHPGAGCGPRNVRARLLVFRARNRVRLVARNRTTAPVTVEVRFRKRTPGALRTVATLSHRFTGEGTARATRNLPAAEMQWLRRAGRGLAAEIITTLAGHCTQESSQPLSIHRLISGQHVWFQHDSVRRDLPANSR
jgi:hypothetical protein